MSQSPVLLRGGVPIVRLADGRMALVLTPAESVLCGENELLPDVLANMKTAVQTALNNPFSIPVSGILQAASTISLDTTKWHECDGTTFTADSYPELAALLPSLALPTIAEADGMKYFIRMK